MSSFDFDAYAASGGWQSNNNDSALPILMPSGSSLPFQGTSFNYLSYSSYHNQMGTYPPQEFPQGTAAGTSTFDVTPIQQGEILCMDMMHANDDIISQTMKMAMWLVMQELFEEQAMAINKVVKKIILNQVVWDSVPYCFGPNEVANVLSSMCSKLVEFMWNGVFHAYRLFPPWYSTMPAVVFHKHMIKKIMHEVDRLFFMHIYTFDQNEHIKIKANFQNFFIMSNMIQFAWSHLCHKFLATINNLTGDE
ncbi:hypothetical protein BDR06DRAFT_973828 [Suillus hirtellus]|nr:hypothetical protein BDR06DRAFT_973828 [Suillus hirtellus]